MEKTTQYMTMADAVQNVGVQAKKTILRWAKADGIQEQYGRTSTGSGLVERVVPVEWVTSKMRERGLQADPVFERVMTLEHATFDPGNRSGLPAPLNAPNNVITPQAMEAIARLHESFQESMRQVEQLIEERARGEEEIKRTVIQGQEEEEKRHAALKRTHIIGFVSMGIGLAALLIGIGFSVRLGFSLHRNQVDQGGAINAQLKRGQETISLLLAALKSENERLRVEEERRANELTELRDAVQALQIGLAQRDERITDVLSARIRRAEELSAELDRIKAEKSQIAEQIKDILATEAARPGRQ